MKRWAILFLSVLVLLCVFSMGTAVTRSSMIQEFEGIYYPLTSRSTPCTDVALNTAITAMQALSPPRTILQLTPVDGAGVACTWTLAANVTVPRGITLRVPDGVRVSVNVGQTLTINGPLRADEPDWYTGDGTVTLTYRDWSVDGFSSYVVSGCLPTVPGASLTLDAFACSAQILSNGQWYPVAQTAAAVGPLSAGDGAYWLALHRDTSTAVGSWTRQAGTHYLWRLIAAQPADPTGGLVVGRITVAAGAITAVAAAPGWRSPDAAHHHILYARDYVTGGDGTPTRPYTGWEALFAQLPARTANMDMYTTVHFGHGYYRHATGMVINRDRVRIQGTGPWTTMLVFAPTANATAWTFVSGNASVLYSASLSNLALTSADTTFTKVGVNLIDVSEFTMRDVTIGPAGAWAGAGSIGLQTNGRELSVIDTVTIRADKPFVIGKNPNYATLDLDAWTFRKIYASALGAFPVYTVNDDTTLTSVTFEQQVFTASKGAFSWIKTAGTAASYQITFRDIRHESPADPAVESLAIINNSAAQIQGVLVDQYVISGSHGVRFFGVRDAVVRLFQFQDASNRGLLADSMRLTLDQCFWQTGSTNTITNMELRLGHRSTASTQTLPTTGVYEPTSNDKKHLIVTDTGYWQGKGTIANGATVTLPLSTAGDVFVVGMITVATSSGSVIEGGQVLADAAAVVLGWGTANFQVGAAAANKITLWREAANTFKLTNSTGSIYNYLVTFAKNP